MTILNESGAAGVLSPLHAVSDLSSLMRDALIVVLGTRSEIHAAQSLPAALSPAPAGFDPMDRRVLFLLLDPDEPPESGRVASRLVEAAAGTRRTGAILLVTARSAPLLGIDPLFETRLAARRLDLPVLSVSLNSRSSKRLSTDLEDAALAALVEACPPRTSDALQIAAKRTTQRNVRRTGLLGGLAGRGGAEAETRRPVVLLGAASGVRDEVAVELERVGVEVDGGIPSLSGVAADLPGLGEDTIIGVTDPHLTGAARAAAERGAPVVRTLMPIGVDGTARFVQDVAAAVGIEVSEVVQARSVWESLGHLRNGIRGKRIFFAGDTGLEIPLARFLVDAGAVVLEVGAPRLDRRFLADELHTLGPGVDVVESPDWRGQLKRADETRPDLVVSGPGLHVPLVAHGHLCLSSRDFRHAGIHGYVGARRVLELFAGAFERAEALDSLDL
ncbi:MAG: nitrogenase component 1 [Rubrobacteraceae bacterium]